VARGVAKGDRVAIAMRNSPSWIAAFIGILKAGGSQLCSTAGGNRSRWSMRSS
jgi:long-subunit acyl-CoA synthetase (AMP-forming)